MTKRSSQSRPKPVCVSTVQRTSCEKTSAAELPLMDRATSMSHAAPESTVAASPVHAMQAR